MGECDIQKYPYFLSSRGGTHIHPHILKSSSEAGGFFRSQNGFFRSRRLLPKPDRLLPSVIMDLLEFFAPLIWF